MACCGAIRRRVTDDSTTALHFSSPSEELRKNFEGKRPFADHHRRLLSPRNDRAAMAFGNSKFEGLENRWPWTPGFLRQLHQIRCAPFFGSHLMLGSDYSGDQGNCPFFVYAFIIADEQASAEWPLRVQRVRQQFLKDDRRMSFKNMNDGQQLFRRDRPRSFLLHPRRIDGRH